MSTIASLMDISNQLADAVEGAATFVVQVRSRRWRPAAGVVFADGHVLVSDHALEHEEDLTVRTHEGRVIAATVAGRDASSNLAVLSVPELGAPPAKPSNATARVGQLAIAVGRSWSGAVIAGAGVISSVGGPWRTGRGPGVEQVIRTDMTPYAGFTGGALLAADGSLLAVLSGILLRGLSLAIPAAVAWPLAEGLARHGAVRRAYLGIAGQPVRLSQSQHPGVRTRGLLIVNVSDDSPARRAGVMIGDVLLSVNGQSVEDPETLLSMLTAELVDRPVPLEVLRAGSVQSVSVTPVAR